MKMVFPLLITCFISLSFWCNSNKSCFDTKPDFVSIIDGRTTIKYQSIKCEISLKHLDPEFNFNNSNLPVNRLEYQWSVCFDNDRDGNFDIIFAVSNFKLPDDTPQRGSIKDFTQSNVWEIGEDSNTSLDFLHTRVEGNSIILESLRWHKQLDKITDHSTIKYKSFYNDGSTIFTDSIVVNGLK